MYLLQNIFRYEVTTKGLKEINVSANNKIYRSICFGLSERDGLKALNSPKYIIVPIKKLFNSMNLC